MQIIAFGYKKGRGKDSCCNFMKDWLQMNRPKLKVRKIGFADKLKDICYQLYGWAGLKPGEYYEYHYAEKEIVLPAIGMSPREIWIKVGNNLRDVYGETWIHYVTKGGVQCDILLVKDMGFFNEATEIVASNGLLYRVDRPGQPNATDAREVELDTWTHWHGCVANNGNLKDLCGQIWKLSENLFP